MKTQNFGIGSSTGWAIRCEVGRINARCMAWADYESKRLNVCGDAKNDVKQQSIPADGICTMIKDGILEGGYYQWECRYDEGPGDKKWMEERDKIYITQLKEKSKNNNKLTEQEQLDLKEVEEQEKKENKLEILEKDENKKIEYDGKEKKGKEKLVENSKKKVKIKVPKDYRCSISQLIMIDPVMLFESGNTYEREEIEQWLKEKNTNPLDGTVLSSKALAPNKALKSAITTFIEKNPELWATDDIYSSSALRKNLVDAVVSGDIQKMNQFLGSDPRLRSSLIIDKETLLMVASRQNKPKVLEVVIDCLGELFDKQVAGKTARVELFERVAEKMGKDGAEIIGKKLNWSENDYQKELFIAIEKGNLAVINVCLSLGAKLAVANEQGDYPIHVAVQSGKVEVLKMFLKSKPDLNIQNSQCNAALHLAAQQGNQPILEILIKAGADLDVKNQQKQRPIAAAKAAGKNEAALFMEKLKQEIKLKPYLEPLFKKIENLEKELGELKEKLQMGGKVENLEEKKLFQEKKNTSEENNMNFFKPSSQINFFQNSEGKKLQEGKVVGEKKQLETYQNPTQLNDEKIFKPQPSM